MLRALLGEPKRRKDELLLDATRSIRAFNKQLRAKYKHTPVENKWVRLDLWATGLYNALNEFEQSCYCAKHFAKRIHSQFEDEMSDAERDHYYRHVYFYKDAFIRLFSLLDKTGYFLDALFGLQTSKVKQKFSYFTVLRQMHETRTHPRLESKLYALKVQYREPLDRMRKKRNLEIHSLNAELIDDQYQAGLTFVNRMKIENTSSNMADLDQCMEMVCRSLVEIFRYSKGVLR